MVNKYKIIKDDSAVIDGQTLYRIKALKDFGDVKKGDLGGYISSKYNLSQTGNCWVYNHASISDNAIVCDNAKIYGTSAIYGDAIIYGDANIHDSVIVCENAKVFGNAKVSDNAVIYGDCEISGTVVVSGNARIFGNCAIYGSVKIHDYAKIYGHSNVFDNVIVYDFAEIYGNTKVYGNARIRGRARVYNKAEVWDNADVSGMSDICDLAKVSGDATIYGDMKIYNDAKISSNLHYVLFGPIGDINLTTFYTTSNNIMASCDRYTGTLEGFKQFVAKDLKIDDVYKERTYTVINYVYDLLRKNIEPTVQSVDYSEILSGISYGQDNVDKMMADEINKQHRKSSSHNSQTKYNKISTSKSYAKPTPIRRK